jgi:CO/xanthine dehydrogenase FAD-binding subunit
MEVLPDFVVRHAETPQEAARLLAGDADARILSGGTG